MQDETMKQVLQHLKTGQIELAEVACPLVRPGHLLIQTHASLISVGTERMLVEFGKGSLLAKARSQPEKVHQVLDKIKADGLLPTLDAVFSRLDEPLPLGYCNVGRVLEVGEGVVGFQIGDRVVSNGAHAEMVCAPRNLCARIPDQVSDDAAVFTVLASIGLQGVRLLEPTLGESIAVTGLGLIGLLAVQLLLANGCRVLGVDVDAKRLELARQFGAETVDLPAGADPVAAAMAFSQGRGVDGVLITASAKSNDVVRQAAQMCRKRGRLVLVGVVGLELSRSDFYKKELSFQVSCSYGPGRYDPAYEERGQDYPLGFVRWTEQRNFEAVLDLLATRRLDTSALISQQIEQARAGEAYRLLTEDRAALGIVLTYPPEPLVRQTVVTATPARRGAAAAERAVVGVVGAGNFARVIALPLLRKTRAKLACIADLDPVAAAHAGRKFGFERTTTDYHLLLTDPQINTLFVFTRHHLHARLVIEALEAGKHVFVEKPLCLNLEELERVRAAYDRAAGRRLLVGFNRRFSPQALKMRALLAGRTQPLTMSMMVNASVSPPESWVHDPRVGGGRIVGEGCHWIDLLMFLAGAPVVRVNSTRVGESRALAVRDDKMTITLAFADGSIGTLHYFGNGHKSYPKETLEVYGDGKVLRLENFRVLRGCGWPGFSRMKLLRPDKGHREEFQRFIETVRTGGASLIPFEEIENVTRASFAAVESAHSGQPVELS
jgi:predicted dehydrogenase/threonine dehydrogenase-like Zn-dependent dehydrogenase